MNTNQEVFVVLQESAKIEEFIEFGEIIVTVQLFRTKTVPIEVTVKTLDDKVLGRARVETNVGIPLSPVVFLKLVKL